MPTFYKGAALGTHWHRNDATRMGLFAMNPGAAPQASRMINHILYNSQGTPFVSVSRSYEVALGYALFTGLGGRIPTRRNRAVVYEITLDDPLPPGVALYDPVQQVLSASKLTAPNSYQHDGGQDFILGVVNETRFGNYLQQLRVTPAGPDVTSPILTRELKTVVRALRDAEVLMTGIAPISNIQRWEVHI